MEEFFPAFAELFLLLSFKKQKQNHIVLTILTKGSRDILFSPINVSIIIV